MAKVESLPESVELLTEQISQSSQNVTALESRIAKVESVLRRFSIIPKLVDQQGRVIASLQSRLPTLDSSQGTNEKNSPESSSLAKVSQTDPVIAVET
jgi:hypothetical protein